MKHLKQKKYSVDGLGSQSETEPCCVCQVNHDFFCFLCQLHACDVHMGYCSYHMNYMMHRRSLKMKMILDHWIAGMIITSTVLNSG